MSDQVDGHHPLYQRGFEDGRNRPIKITAIFPDETLHPGHRLTLRQAELLNGAILAEKAERPVFRPKMTPTRLRDCLDILEWTQRGLARILNRPEGTVRQWARGAVRIPPDVAAWLETRARSAEASPPPARTSFPEPCLQCGAQSGNSHSVNCPESEENP